MGRRITSFVSKVHRGAGKMNIYVPKSVEHLLEHGKKYVIIVEEYEKGK